MRPSSLGGGRILRRTLSVRLSVCLSVRPVIITERHVAPPSELQWLMYFSAHRGPHIVRPSRPHKLVFHVLSLDRSCLVVQVIDWKGSSLEEKTQIAAYTCWRTLNPTHSLYGNVSPTMRRLKPYIRNMKFWRFRCHKMRPVQNRPVAMVVFEIFKNVAAIHR